MCIIHDEGDDPDPARIVLPELVYRRIKRAQYPYGEAGGDTSATD
jgi:hypothetical protein